MKKCFFSLLLLLTLLTYGQDSGNLDQSLPKTKTTFKLYPNPAVNDIVYVTTAENGVKNIVVYDVFGEIVLIDRISSKSLNISKLVPGVYVLQVIENEKTMTRKLVVK